MKRPLMMEKISFLRQNVKTLVLVTTTAIDVLMLELPIVGIKKVL
jgi:hypothetical protein